MCSEKTTTLHWKTQVIREILPYPSLKAGKKIHKL